MKPKLGGVHLSASLNPAIEKNRFVHLGYGYLVGVMDNKTIPQA